MRYFFPLFPALILFFWFCGETSAQTINPEEIVKKAGLKQLAPQDPLQRALNEAQKSVTPKVVRKNLDSDTQEMVEKLPNPFIPKIPSAEGPKPAPTAPIPKQQSNLPLPKAPVNQNEPAKPNFHISGIVWNSSRPQAIINDQVYSEGDTLESWTITKISKEGVSVSSQNINFLIEP